MDHVLEELRKALPAVFAGTSLDELTGNAIRWATTQNRRAQRKIPDKCFCRSGPRVLVIRDPFLDWWQTTLTEAREKHRRQWEEAEERRTRAIDELADLLAEQVTDQARLLDLLETAKNSGIYMLRHRLVAIREGQ